MLRKDESNPWDTLRLIDFGFAREFMTGKAVADTELAESHSAALLLREVVR